MGVWLMFDECLDDVLRMCETIWDLKLLETRLSCFYVKTNFFILRKVIEVVSLETLVKSS